MNRDVSTEDLSTKSPGLPEMATMELSHQNYWETLSDSSDIFFKSLKLGRVRGIVTVTEFPTSGNTAAELLSVIRELISRDILVAVCSEESMTMEQGFFEDTDDGLAEFCDFIGVQPVMLMEPGTAQNEITDFYTSLAEIAGVSVSSLPVATLTAGPAQTTLTIPAALFVPENDPVATADAIDHHIHDKRGEAQWCDRCGGRFSPFS